MVGEFFSSQGRIVPPKKLRIDEVTNAETQIYVDSLQLTKKRKVKLFCCPDSLNIIPVT